MRKRSRDKRRALFFFKIDPKINVAEQIFGKYCSNDEPFVERLFITHVAVYKTPLDGIYRSSGPNIRRVFGKQWTSVDFHAFVVLETNDSGLFLCLEKQHDGIYIGKSSSKNDLISEKLPFSRKPPVSLVIEDSSDNFPVRRLFKNIENQFSGYNPADDNCQHFAKRIFDKIASRKTWKYTGPREYLYEKCIILILSLILCYVAYQKIPPFRHGIDWLLKALCICFNCMVYICYLCCQLIYIVGYNLMLTPVYYILYVLYMGSCHVCNVLCLLCCFLGKILYLPCYYVWYILYMACYYIFCVLIKLIYLLYVVLFRCIMVVIFILGFDQIADF